MAGRYYWFKLKKDFFSRAEIVMLEKQRKGKAMVLLYLKLLLLALETEGYLEYAEGQPHTLKTMAAGCGCSLGFMRKLIRRLRQIGLLEQQGECYYLPGVVRDTGSESKYAEQKRRYRDKTEAFGQCPTPHRTMSDLPSDNVRQRKSIEKEKEKEKESESDYCTGAVSPCAKLGQDLTDWERKHLQDRLGPVKLLHYLEIAEDRAVLGQPSRNLYQDICRWEREGTYPMN